MAEMAKAIKQIMKDAGGSFEYLTRNGNVDFTCCATLVYQKHNQFGRHADQVFLLDGTFNLGKKQKEKLRHSY